MKRNIFKVICIYANGTSLKPNGIYKAKNSYSDTYFIYRHDNNKNIYSTFRFKTIKELRKERLNKLI